LYEIIHKESHENFYSDGSSLGLWIFEVSGSKITMHLILVNFWWRLNSS
jgi:hypothetical protein